MSAKTDKMLEEIDSLTVVELSELVKGIEEKYGVTAAAVAAPAAGGAADPPVPFCLRRDAAAQHQRGAAPACGRAAERDGPGRDPHRGAQPVRLLGALGQHPAQPDLCPAQTGAESAAQRGLYQRALHFLTYP